MDARTGPTVLSKEEDRLAKHVVEMPDMVFGLSHEDYENGFYYS